MNGSFLQQTWEKQKEDIKSKIKAMQDKVAAVPEGIVDTIAAVPEKITDAGEALPKKLGDMLSKLLFISLEKIWFIIKNMDPWIHRSMDLLLELLLVLLLLLLLIVFIT